jgi:hypothetical protein
MSETFGHKVCDVPTYEHVWVDFKQNGYPRKLRREWDAADADETLRIVLRYVVAWSVTDLDGQAVENTSDGACLDNVEDAVVAWLVRAFVKFWLAELSLPRPNSSAPSPAT